VADHGGQRVLLVLLHKVVQRQRQLVRRKDLQLVADVLRHQVLDPARGAGAWVRG
jgi:hypothetical protein